MPMLTTVRTRAPVTPVHSPERTLSANANILASSACTSVSMSCPSTTSGGCAPAGRRRAVCRTARSSVTLMWSPRSCACSRSARPTSSASRTSRASVSSVTRFLDRSTVRSASGRVRRVARSGSSANQPRRSGVSVDSWTLSSCQAAVDVASIGEVGMGPPYCAGAAPRTARPRRLSRRRRRSAATAVAVGVPVAIETTSRTRPTSPTTAATTSTVRTSSRPGLPSQVRASTGTCATTRATISSGTDTGNDRQDPQRADRDHGAVQPRRALVAVAVPPLDEDGREPAAEPGDQRERQDREPLQAQHAEVEGGGVLAR